MKNPNILNQLRDVFFVSLMGFSATKDVALRIPEPPTELPPRLGDACVNSGDVFIPDFDPQTNEVRRNSSWKVAIFDKDTDKPESPWYSVDMRDHNICVGTDEDLEIALGLVAVGKQGGHGLMPILFEYGRDGVKYFTDEITADEPAAK